MPYILAARTRFRGSWHNFQKPEQLRTKTHVKKYCIFQGTCQNPENASLATLVVTMAKTSSGTSLTEIAAVMKVRSMDLFAETIGEVSRALFWEAKTTNRFRELRAMMGSCRPQLNKNRHVQWIDIMSVLTEKGNRRYTDGVDFEVERDDESDGGKVEERELKTSGMPSEEYASNEEISV